MAAAGFKLGRSEYRRPACRPLPTYLPTYACKSHYYFRVVVVSVLAFYSHDPSSNPVETCVFSVEFVFDKNENKQKEAGVGPFLKKHIIF